MEKCDVKNWSYADFDEAILRNENEIAKLETDLKILRSDLQLFREVKSQKILDESKAMIVESKIDFSLADFQAFLESKIKIDNDNNVAKTRSRKSRPKKINLLCLVKIFLRLFRMSETKILLTKNHNQLSTTPMSHKLHEENLIRNGGKKNEI